MPLFHGGFKDQCLSPSFILIDSELVLSFLHFQIGFLACSLVRHACICVYGSGSHDNLKQRHICKRAEVNRVWVLLKSCRIEDCSKTCSSIRIRNATMPWRFRHRSLPCRIMIDSGLLAIGWVHLCMAGLWKQPVHLCIGCKHLWLGILS